MAIEMRKYEGWLGRLTRRFEKGPVPRSFRLESDSGQIGLIVLNHVNGEPIQNQHGKVADIVADPREWGKILQEFGLSRRQVGKVNIIFKDKDIPAESQETPGIEGAHDRRTVFHPKHKNEVTMTLRGIGSELARKYQEGTLSTQDFDALNKDLHAKTIDETIAFGHAKDHQRMRKRVLQILPLAYPATVVGRLAFYNAIGKDIPEVGLGAFIRNHTGIDIFSINPHLTDFLHLLAQVPFMVKDLRTLAISAVGIPIALGMRYLMNKGHERRYEKHKKEAERKHSYIPEALPLAQVDPEETLKPFSQA